MTRDARKGTVYQTKLPKTRKPCCDPVRRPIIRTGSPRFPGHLRLPSGHRWKQDLPLNIIRLQSESSTLIDSVTIAIELEGVWA
ncbi:hypothetical protein TNCV_672951 [Trichonephila clavipes]|nr:hypothetical protein TNCV_672951 [Trichonephila clavipes]